MDETLETKNFECQVCKKSFKYKNSRDAHEQKHHSIVIPSTKLVTQELQKEDPRDHIFEYQKALLSLNILLISMTRYEKVKFKYAYNIFIY